MVSVLRDLSFNLGIQTSHLLESVDDSQHFRILIQSALLTLQSGVPSTQNIPYLLFVSIACLLGLFLRIWVWARPNFQMVKSCSTIPD